MHWAHVDNPGSSTQLRVLSLITSAKSLLPCKVTHVPGIRTWTYWGVGSLFSLATGPYKRLHQQSSTTSLGAEPGATENGRSQRSFRLSPEDEGSRFLPGPVLFRTSSELSPKRLPEKSSLWVFPILLPLPGLPGDPGTALLHSVL